MKLTIELVPKTSWGHNVRMLVTKAAWNEIRQKCYREAGNRCQVCNGVGKRHPVECHEVWHYDDAQELQTLRGFIALCPGCHKAKHLGQAFTIGRGEEALRHLARVNEWTIEEARLYIDEVFDTWLRRSQQAWKVDISFIDEYI